MNKKVSVIVPCYNIEQYIERFFASLENQVMPFEEFEIILVDDCSKDHTWEKICAFEQKHPEQVIAIQNEVNSRQGFSRNSALSYASGEYIAFLDGDDWVEPDYLSAMYEKAVAYDCDMVVCNAWRDFGDGEKLEMKKVEMQTSRFLSVDSSEIRKRLIENDAFGVTAWGKLFKRSFFMEHALYFPEGMVFEDVGWGILPYLYFTRVYVMEDYLYHYFVNRNSVVLKKGQDYYYDLFKANYYKYEQLQERGAFDGMRDVLEFDFIVSFYLSALKMFGNHYDSIPAQAFEELQQFMLTRFPDCMHNPYIQTNLDERSRMQIFFLDKKMSQKELSELHRILSMRA